MVLPPILTAMPDLFETTERISFTPTRKAGLARLEAFRPRMGRHYAQTRNTDLGPNERTNVSALSPWVRSRLVREEELARAALDQYSYATAEKFHQEICWRSYFKGWLEHRPAVWDDFVRQRDHWYDALAENSGLRKAYDKAIHGRTGIEGFDDWAHELVETGYLHNHARMWFASIWLFTLKLPLELGADFFLRHLIDGDAASNTLSWRWVGGLHTKDKTYLARTSNIEKHTNGRFSPDRLASEAPPLAGFDNPAPQKLNLPDQEVSGEVGLLLTEEDLHLSSLVPAGGKVKAIAGCVFPNARSPEGAGNAARTFVNGALDDALRRGMERFSVPTRRLEAEGFEDGVLNWAKEAGLNTVITGYAPVGWVRPKIQKLRDVLAEEDINLVEIVRDWDGLFWPHAKKGFFQLKKQIPSVYAELGLPV